MVMLRCPAEQLVNGKWKMVFEWWAQGWPCRAIDGALIKKKIKFSSFMRKFRVEQLQC